MVLARWDWLHSLSAGVQRCKTKPLAAFVGGLFYAQLGFAGSSATNYLPSAVDISPSVAVSWQEVDVSPFVPLGATGVMVDCYNPTGTARNYDIRKNGSTHAALVQAKDDQHGGLMAGLDSGRKLEIYTERLVVKTYLLGYTMESVAFFTNRIDKSPS